MKMLKNVSVDLLGGAGALLWAIIAKVALPALGELVDPMVAIAFALAALGRWYASGKKAARGEGKPQAQITADSDPKPEPKPSSPAGPDKDTLDM